MKKHDSRKSKAKALVCKEKPKAKDYSKRKGSGKAFAGWKRRSKGKSNRGSS